MRRPNDYTDESPMPFGKYKGKAMADVPAGYLDWLMGMEWIGKWPAVTAYINENRSAIDKELEEQRLV